MRASAAVVAVALAAGLAAGPGVSSVARAEAPSSPSSPSSGRWPVAEPAAARAMLDRLVGQRAGWHDGVLTIVDIAGAGPPWIGVVERRGQALWLVGDGVAWRLSGPLARPRLAGPGYLIWAIGAPAGDRLEVTRLGVLAPPPR